MSAKKEVEKAEGFIVEIFSSFQGEGGSVIGSCFGKRQIFVRFAGCNLKCEWCDTAKSRDPTYPKCNVEITPGSWSFKEYSNPVSEEFILEQISCLTTKDLHSISLTGGEPAFQEHFFYRIVKRFFDLKYPVFLETNGFFPERIANIAPFISYACVDIKDRSAKSLKDSEWLKLLEKEMESMILLQNFAKVFAKLVVTDETIVDDVRLIAKKLQQSEIPLAIQPVTPVGKVKPVSAQKLFTISETIAEELPLEQFGISIQGHKMINLL